MDNPIRWNFIYCDILYNIFSYYNFVNVAHEFCISLEFDYIKNSITFFKWCFLPISVNNRHNRWQLAEEGERVVKHVYGYRSPSHSPHLRRAHLPIVAPYVFCMQTAKHLQAKSTSHIFGEHFYTHVLLDSFPFCSGNEYTWCLHQVTDVCRILHSFHTLKR